MYHRKEWRSQVVWSILQSLLLLDNTIVNVSDTAISADNCPSISLHSNVMLRETTEEAITKADQILESAQSSEVSSDPQAMQSVRLQFSYTQVLKVKLVSWIDRILYSYVLASY